MRACLGACVHVRVDGWIGVCSQTCTCAHIHTHAGGRFGPKKEQEQRGAGCHPQKGIASGYVPGLFVSLSVCVCVYMSVCFRLCVCVCVDFLLSWRALVCAPVCTCVRR